MHGPATSIASQVRTGRKRAVEVVADALEAARQAHESLNAFTLIDPSGAMHRAEAVDRLVDAGKDPGPLAGVPVVLKDIIDDAGYPTTSGASFPTKLVERSAPVVRRLGAAGGVIIGRTGLHEFAFGFTSENPWFGPVRNPWDTDTSAGGSSGGTGSAVAAGVTPIGIGTDTGGSVRVPAAMCGVMGLKVTHGRIPLTGVFPLVASLDTVGPIARTIDDLALAYAVMAGDDASDPWSQPRTVDPMRPVDLADISLGVVAQWQSTPMSTEVRDGFARFLEMCEAAKVTIVEIDDPVFDVPPELLVAIGPEILGVHRERFSAHPERYGQDVAARLRSVAEGTAADVITAERWGSAARAAIGRLTADGIGAIVTPTVGALRKEIGIDTVEVEGGAVQHRQALAAFTAPINRIRVPALSAPVSGTAAQGASVQLIGEMWAESTLLGIGRALEEAGVLEVRTPPIFFDPTPE